MRRFFFAPENKMGDRVRLGAEESHHLLKVLRLGQGSEVELLDGTGWVYRATISSVERYVELLLGESYEEEPEEGPELLLLQSVLKGEKMDLVVQKATELGVTRMLPVHTSRCQGKLSSSIKRRTRWQRISLAACKQCLRARPMEILEPVSLQSGLARVPENFVKILFWEEERQCSLREYSHQFDTAAGVALLLGPEGGISEEESAIATNFGWQTAQLGRRILRAETATITAVSLAQFLVGRV